MKILFKQFFKTFKKNFFLVFGLTSLMMVLSFLVSTCINISISFSNALDTLNSKGNKANIVSSAPSDFGYLDFSYNQLARNNKEPYWIYSSSIDVQYNPKTGKFDRTSNTFFPYNKIQLNNRKKSFGINEGISINTNALDYKDMFIFDFNNPNPSWNFNNGLTIAEPIQLTGFNKNKAIAWSFADSMNKVVFDPQTFLFNAYGIPIFIFGKGNLTNEVSLIQTIDDLNNSVVNAFPNIYDNQGLGITNAKLNNKPINVFFNRSKLKIHKLHDSSWNFIFDPGNFKIWAKSNNYLFDIFSHFIQKKAVNTVYKYTYNFENSSGPIKKYLKDNPLYFEKAFNDIFYGNNISRNVIPGVAAGQVNNVNPNISLVKNNDNSYTILLAIDDNMFIDYNSIILDPNKVDANQNKIPLQVQLEQQKQQQINQNKKIYLNNFKGFLSSKFTKKLENYFLEDATKYFNSHNIEIKEERQYYYLDTKTQKEYLYVSKKNDNVNDIVIEQGNNILNDNMINNLIVELNKKINHKISTNTFYAIKKLIDIAPESNFPSRPNKIPNKIENSGTDYLWFSLLRFCLDKTINELDKTSGINAELPDSILSNPYFLILLKLLYNFNISFNGNFIEAVFRLMGAYTTLWHDSKLYISIFNNYFCVINSAYADLNNKKYLPVNSNKNKVEIWIQKINDFKNAKDPKIEFTNWLNNIKSTDLMLLNVNDIKTIFINDQDFFNIWIDQLDDSYKINYQNNVFLINGFGISPDFSYPSISPISPVPNPQNQCIVFLNEITFNTLNINDVNKVSYFIYNSNKLNDSEIINTINKYTQQKLSCNYFNPEYINDATNLNQIWLRVYFPIQIKNLIIIFSVIGSVFIILLSVVVVYLLLKSFIKNMLEPIALCMGNGIDLYKIIAACMMNLGVITTVSTMISYVIAYFAQNSIISLFSSIWLVPNTFALSFSPAIFIPLVIITFLVFGGLLSLIIYRRFKKPIPQIIANKQDVKSNFFTNILRRSRSRLPTLFKLTISYSSINIGRISLLAILGAIALGGIVSSSMINEKFYNSKINTQESTQYNYNYNFININESTGLYKPQKFSEIGFEDPSVGINSIYLSKNEFDKTDPKLRLPYYKEELVIHEIPQGGNEQNIKIKTYANNQNKYLCNMIFPSYNVYLYIIDHNVKAFFNGSASVFLLDLPINFAGALKINIWEFIKPNFPIWLVSQLEKQIQIFQDTIMNYYGEWYYKFINIKKQSSIIDQDNNDNLTINNVDKINNSGYYYAEATNANNKKIKSYTKPYYVWIDSDEWYQDNNTNIAQRIIANSNENISLNFNRNTSFYKKENGKFQQNPISTTDNVVWKFVPAYNFHHEIDGEKSNENSADPYLIKYNQKFINFITTIYGDERVSNNDSKISFGILPFDKNTDETYSLVNAKITKVRDRFNKAYNPNDDIQILGIKPNSKYSVLKNDDNQNISNLLKESNNVINVIINNGASLKYNLDINDVFDAQIINNSLYKSFTFLQDMLNLKMNNPINLNYQFKVVGINNDSFGTKFYINQNDANRILGLKEMPIYSNLLPSIKTIFPSSNTFIPFNGIFSKNQNLIISNNSVPFYTFANMWSIITKTSDLTTINNIDTIFDSILTHNDKILLEIAKYIKSNFDNTFVYDPQNMIITRNNILAFIKENFTSSAFLRTMNDVNQKFLLQSSINNCIPTSTTNKMFDIIGNLAVTLIIIVISIIIPLLIIVTLVTSLSIVNDLYKNIGLMKVLGFSNRNIIVSFIIMYSSILIITILLGLAIMFACTYSIQSLVFNLSSIFITNYVQPSTFFIGVGASVGIFALTILFIGFLLLKKQLQNSIKF